MANRVVEIFYRMKDLFTPEVKKITGGYTKLDDASNKHSRTLDKNTKKNVSSLQKMQKVLTTLRTGWVTLAATIAGSGVVRAINEFASKADAVGKLSDKLGVAAEELTAVGYAAERSNIEFNTLATAVQRMTRRASEAAKGLGEAKDAFKELGIDAKTFTQLGLEDQMSLLADAFSSVGNQGDRVRLAFKIFDTEGVSMVNMLQNGSAEMAKLTAEARRLGITLDDEATKAARDYADTLAVLGATAEGVWNNLAGRGVNVINDFAADLGVSAQETANLEKEMEFLQKRLRLGRVYWDSLSPYTWWTQLQNAVGDRDFRSELELVQNRLEELKNTQEESAEITDDQRKAQEERTELLKEQGREYDLLADRATRAAKDIEAAYKKETADLRKARAEQKQIQDEFDDLVKDVTEVEDEDVGLGDVFGKINQGAAAVERGEFGKAVELAREGGDLLGKLKEEGTETTSTLKYLAEQLRKVAVEASAQTVGNEEEEKKVAAARLQTYNAQLEVLKNTAKDQGAAAGLEYMEAMQAAMSRFDLTLPAPRDIAPAQARRSVSGSAYTDGTDFRQAVDAVGPK